MDTKHAAEAECVKTALRAALMADTADPSGFAACYAPDAEFVRPTTPEPVKGRAALEDMMKRRPAQMVGRHLISNMQVTAVNDHEADGLSYFTTLVAMRQDGSGDGALPMEGAPHSMGEYRYRFAKVDGQWLIQRQVGRFAFLRK